MQGRAQVGPPRLQHGRTQVRRKVAARSAAARAPAQAQVAGPPSRLVAAGAKTWGRAGAAAAGTLGCLHNQCILPTAGAQGCLHFHCTLLGVFSNRANWNGGASCSAHSNQALAYKLPCQPDSMPNLPDAASQELSAQGDKQSGAPGAFGALAFCASFAWPGGTASSWAHSVALASLSATTARELGRANSDTDAPSEPMPRSSWSLDTVASTLNAASPSTTDNTTAQCMAPLIALIA